MQIDLGNGLIIDVERQIEEINRVDCEDSLYEFVRQMWHVVEPATPMVGGWAMEAICEHLEAVSYGDITRLLINVPPGSSKSLLCNVFWPAWEWAMQPHLRYLSFSYAAQLTERDNRRFRDVILSETYQRRWGRNFRLMKKGEEYVSTDKTGFKVASSIGGVSTGARGDRVILDDPHNVKDQESDVTRKGAVEWFATAMSNRLNDMTKSAIVVIMQRVHEEDVSGYILDKGLPYEHLMIPAEYEPDRHSSTKIGWEDPRTEAGESFWPERFPLHPVLSEQRKLMGPFGFCNPTEAPVLMADLTMKPIGDVREGDEVIGFDLDTTAKGEGAYSRRALKTATVTAISRWIQPVVKMTLDSGEVIRCTPNHKWYKDKVRTDEGRERSPYGPAKVGTALMRVCPPRLPEITDPDDIRDAGWLSGFFDGEGSVSLVKRVGGGTAKPLITFTQGTGRNAPLCDKLERLLTKFGFAYNYLEGIRSDRNDASESTNIMRSYWLTGQRLPLIQRFLHIVQPVKWRERLIENALGAMFISGRERVVSIEPDGEEEVFGLTTTTGNYVVWGFASSNSGQYQQRPDPAGGGIIKRDWWQLWEDDAFPPMDYILASLDTAYTEKTMNDPSAMTIWGVFSTDPYATKARTIDADGRPVYLDRVYAETAPKVMLMGAWRERLEFPQLREKVANTCKRFKVDRLIIENKAAGISLAQELRTMNVGADFAVQLMDPKSQDKLSRLYSVQHLFAEGMIHAPDRSWADMVITEVAAFPKSKHDDLTDTVSQALRHMRDIGLLQRSQEKQAEIAESSRYQKPLPPLYPV